MIFMLSLNLKTNAHVIFSLRLKHSKKIAKIAVMTKLLKGLKLKFKNQNLLQMCHIKWMNLLRKKKFLGKKGNMEGKL